MPDLFAAVVPDSLLTVLRVIFLILLYLFFVRVIRAVWSELREPKSVEVFAGGPDLPAPAAGAGPRPGPLPRGRRAAGRRRAGRPQGAGLRAGRRAHRRTGRRLRRVALPDDTFVSQVHARVFRRDGSLFVEDLGSTNGTFLNRKAVSGPMALRKGDRVQVGRSVLEVTR